MKKKKRILIGITTLIVLGSIVFGAVYLKKQKAGHEAQQKQETLTKEENEALETAELAVEKAYETRDEKDVKKANAAISKLSVNQKKDKKKLTNKMEKLAGFLNQIAKVKAALAKTEKSKDPADVKTAQILIANMTDDFFEKDRKSAQKKLDAIKAKISKEKKKATADEESTEQETDNPVQDEQQELEEQAEQQYQEPQYQAPQYQVPQYQAPPRNPGQTQTPKPAPTPAPDPSDDGGASNNQGSEGNEPAPTPPPNIDQGEEAGNSPDADGTDAAETE